MKTGISPAIEGGTGSSETLRERFLRSACELEEIGRSRSYRILATTNKKLPLFQSISYDKQLQAVEILEKACGIYRAMTQENLDIKNTASVVWMALRHLDVVPPSNFFDKIGNDDVVEIYSNQNYHLFANFRFYEVCSYTLEQIYSQPWPTLWQRDPKDLAQLEKTIGHVLGEQTEALMLKDHVYKITEIASPFKFELIYTAKCIAPIWFRKPRVKAGFMIIENGEILNAPQPKEEEHLLTEFYKDFEPTQDTESL